MQSKQLVEAEAKTQQSTIKKQKMAAETTAEVVWRPSAEDGKAATVAVAAKATSEGGGLAGRRKNGGDRSDSRRRVQRSSSNVIDDCKSWSNTSPNNSGECGGDGSGSGGGGGSGGEKNRHTPSSYRRRTAILPGCTNSRCGVLNVVHCLCIVSQRTSY
jgi:uncharacterized membrane protein YgcG